MESLLDDRVRLYRGFFDADEAAALFQRLARETPWLEVRYENEGRAHTLPRLTANYGERSYDYAGLVFTPLPWTPLLTSLRSRMESLAGQPFNALIVQVYRDGEDAVNWHADSHPAGGDAPTIASLSFGASRRFQLRRPGQRGVEVECTLASGDVLIMRGDLQRTHVHKVPREENPVGPRINLTFRRLDGHSPPLTAPRPHTSRVVPWPFL
ncbi:MAG: alpha-ketoglutarate-dependent dioxygenase AlkB [Polyangiales bacterium]